MRLRGQISSEHAILLGIVTAAMLGMQLYAKRGLQAGMKASIDWLSPFRIDGKAAGDPDGERAQLAGMAYESGERRNRAVAEPGSPVAREVGVTAESSVTQKIHAQEAGSGQIVTTTETTETSSSSGTTSQGGGVSQYSEVVVEASR